MVKTKKKAAEAGHDVSAATLRSLLAYFCARRPCAPRADAPRPAGDADAPPEAKAPPAEPKPPPRPFPGIGRVPDPKRI